MYVNLPDMLSYVIDDDEDSRIIGEVIFNNYLGITTSAFDNPFHALDACKEEMPDLILLDWMMPHMNGIQFLEILKTQPGADGVTVIMATALNDRRNVEEALAAGAKGYLAKPFRIDTVIKQLASIGVSRSENR